MAHKPATVVLMEKVCATRILILLLSLWASGAWASATMNIEGTWKYHDGYQPLWVSADYDDQHWQDIQVPGLLGQAHNTTVFATYRLQFFVDPANVDYDQAIYIDAIRNGDRSYLNGEEIGRTGTLEAAWQFSAKNPESLARVYAIPKDLLKPGNNLLVVKVNTGFGNAWGALYPGGAGISSGPIMIGKHAQLSQMAYQKSLQTTAFDMFCITLGLIDLLIIGILLKRAVHHIPEFRWLFWGSMLMMLGTVGHDVFYLLIPEAPGLNFVLFSSMMMIPMVNALYFWSQNKNLPLRLIQIITSIWLICYLSVALPGVNHAIKIMAWYAISALLFSSFIYTCYCAYLGVRFQRVGAIAQAIGLLIYILSIRSQWLPDLFLEHRNIQIGSLIFRYALLFAYFQKMEEMKISFQSLSQKIFAISDSTRSEIARELHDGLGQNLSSAKLQIKLAKHSGNTEHMDNAEGELSSAVSGMRRLINGLHISLIDQMGFYPAVKQEINKLAGESGVEVIFELDEIKLSGKTEQNLYRIMQECSRNAIRHGQATQLRIILKKNSDIMLCIEDDGTGFDPHTIKPQSTENGFGMVSLKERVELLNGSLDISNCRPQGTRIAIALPLTREKV